MIGGIGGVVMVAGVGTASYLACRPPGGLAELQIDRLRVALADMVAPTRIAEAYRASRSPEALLDEFAGKPGLQRATTQRCPAALRDCVREQVKSDFSAGDVVLTDRFIIARSEGILAALLV